MYQFMTLCSPSRSKLPDCKRAGRRREHKGEETMQLRVLAMVVCLALPSAVSENNAKAQEHRAASAGQIHERTTFRFPLASLVADSRGNLYGAVGSISHNTIYRFSPRPGGGWTHREIYSSLNNVGIAQPSVLDASGNLYGTTFNPGVFGNCGIAFELSPTTHGPWKKTTLRTFPTAEGICELGRLVMDAKGNLFGASAVYATSSQNIYEFKRSSKGKFSFSLISGPAIFLGLVDDKDNLFGTGPQGVVEVSPNRNGTWAYNTIYNYGSTDGLTDALVLDRTGNLLGFTSDGGTTSQGEAFQLSPDSHGGWTFSLLFSFTNASGYYPSSIYSLQPGALIGTNTVGDSTGLGNVFTLIRLQDGTWKEDIVHTFRGGDDGDTPEGLVPSKGNLFGSADRVVFEVIPD
jgi:hypothetical protein